MVLPVPRTDSPTMWVSWKKCENGIVYTIEGNSGDSCRQRQYSVGYYEILGYGIPAY